MAIAKNYDTSPSSASHAEEPAVAYMTSALPLQQQTTMEAIMLMFSTLTEHNKRNLALKIESALETNDSYEDAILAQKLQGLPSWDEVDHESLDNLTPDDYKHFVRARKPMKGIEKCL